MNCPLGWSRDLAASVKESVEILDVEVDDELEVSPVLAGVAVAVLLLLEVVETAVATVLMAAKAMVVAKSVVNSPQEKEVGSNRLNSRIAVVV